MAAFLDDRWYENAKWERLEDDSRVWGESFSLWAAANAYCKANKTGGSVTLRRLEKITPFKRSRIKLLAKELVRVELWHENGPDSWRFHNWEKWSGKWEDNTEETRTKGRIRQQKHRDKKRGATPRNALRDGDSNALRDGDSNALRNERHTGSCLTDPYLTKPIHTEDSARDLRVDFSRRYESARGGLTWPSGRHDRQTTDLAGWLRANPSVDRGVMLDNFFADSWAESKGFPFGALAKDPAKYAVPPAAADPAAAAAAAEAELREAERKAYEDMGGEIKL